MQEVAAMLQVVGYVALLVAILSLVIVSWAAKRMAANQLTLAAGALGCALIAVNEAMNGQLMASLATALVAAIIFATIPALKRASTVRKAKIERVIFLAYTAGGGLLSLGFWIATRSTGELVGAGICTALVLFGLGLELTRRPVITAAKTTVAVAPAKPQPGSAKAA